MTTPRMLRHLEHARKVKLKQLKSVSVSEGPVMDEVPSQGFLEVDGVYKLTQGDEGILLVAGTVTANSEFRPVAYAVSSGETSWCIEMFLRSVDLGAQRFFVDQRVLFRPEWLMADALPSLQLGLRKYLGLSDETVDGNSGLSPRSVLAQFICALRMFHI